MKKLKDKSKGIDVITEIISNRGITLIALIITIIILIILASVAITLSLSDNGIFYWAKQARNLTNEQEATDRMNLKILTAQTNKYAENQEMPTLKELSEILKEDEEIQYITETSKLASVEYNVPSENPTSIYTKLKKYSYEFEINSQLKLVKIDGKEITDSNQQNNNKNPGGDDQAEIKPGESGYAGGSYNDPYIPKGFKHTDGTWNSGYTIIGETVSVGNEFVWVPCVLTETEKSEAKGKGDNVELFKKTMPQNLHDSSDPNWRYFDSYTGDLGDDLEGTEKIENSVGVYQGFYIAKYEAGIPGSDSSSLEDHNTPNSGEILPVSKPKVGVWNFVTLEEAMLLSNKMIDEVQSGVHSTLISGAAWDTTLQWIVNSSDNSADYKEYDIKTGQRGNYNNKKIWVTAQQPYCAANNIYDMGGNVEEFTTEQMISGADGVSLIKVSRRWRLFL